MQLTQYITFAALFLIQAITTPTFLKVEIPEPSKKSLLWKMICSTIFVVVGALAMIFAENYSVFAILMMIGFFFSWWGDFLLHVSGKPIFFLFGLISFLVGHLMYISAYTVAMHKVFPDVSFIGVPEMIAYIAIVCFALFTLNNLKVEFGDAYLPCLIYLCTIGVMVIKAFSFSMHIMLESATDMPIFTGIMLMVGAILFMLSDYSLAILTFTKGVKKHGKLRNFNIWTYFFGQMCLGMTILFISA